ncbi:hypothetical protein [Methylosinus sp. LW3]|uniref:hypothetical protein n=1 Tax=Methylosinus sp. LW3 TaxID=107635 RepID=UPI000464144F|nr:hypothetical protein [Methylosinus sp. LW3]
MLTLLGAGLQAPVVVDDELWPRLLRRQRVHRAEHRLAKRLLEGFLRLVEWVFPLLTSSTGC